MLGPWYENETIPIHFWHLTCEDQPHYLYRYFKASDTKLPDPRGPLSKEVPLTAIAAANGEVKHVVELQRGKTRGPYTKFTPEQKAEIGKRAAEHGVVATVRYYEKRFPGKLAPTVSANGRGQLESSIHEIYFRENFVPRKFGAIR